MEIRIAQAGDLDRIVEIYNQAVATGRSTGDIEPVDMQAQMLWFTEHIPDKYPVYVAELGSRVVGYNALSEYRDGRPAFRYTLETSYYVDQAYHRQGIAGQLMEVIIKSCREMGIKRLITFVLEHNEPSILFLEKLGFERWGLLPGVADFNGNECDHTIYGRRVGN